ncbi:MAG: fumarate hydratase [Candidatus Methanofastidiosia archaeon]
MISDQLIEDTVVELLKRAVVFLPDDVVESIENAYKREDTEVARMQLKAILDNIKLARETQTPMCQDTGILLFYVKPSMNLGTDIEKVIRKAVKKATPLVPLRPNAVDPLSRTNPGTNVGVGMPHINYEMPEGNFTEITVFPKGAGSENMSRLLMLTPSQGIKGIKEFVLDSVLNAAGKPCPPTIVGVGIGGSADISMKLAKKALLRPLGQRNKDKRIAGLEQELYNALNKTGIGPMGLGGKTTVLGVSIEFAYCHTASHPVAVNIQCWAARRATARIHDNGEVKFL